MLAKLVPWFCFGIIIGIVLEYVAFKAQAYQLVYETEQVHKHVAQ